jgi:hypothetical protein
MNKPKYLFFGENWVGWTNMLFLQWFFIRLYYTDGLETKYGFLKFIVPLTGWTFLPFKEFKYL